MHTPVDNRRLHKPTGVLAVSAFSSLNPGGHAFDGSPDGIQTINPFAQKQSAACVTLVVVSRHLPATGSPAVFLVIQE